MYHRDLVDSTMLTTDNTGAELSRLSYAAFGEPVGEGGIGVPPVDVGTRYQYAGGWGYETGLPTEEFPYSDLITLWGANPDLPPIVLLHVGYRWYDPALGRFVQRDPVGMFRALNA